MRVNEGPAFVSSIEAKASSESEREKTGDASVLAQSSSRERARIDKDPDVPTSQGVTRCSLGTKVTRAASRSRKRKTVAVLADGRPFGSRKLPARHGAGGGNGLGRSREKRRLASKTSVVDSAVVTEGQRCDRSHARSDAEQAPSARAAVARSDLRGVNHAFPRPHASAGPSLPVHASRFIEQRCSINGEAALGASKPEWVRRSRKHRSSWDHTA
jgi:hypothetical protein